MITRGIRSFMSRDWRAARDAKDTYWLLRVEALGPGESLRIADELRRQAVGQHPDWPSPEDRNRDLESHMRVAGLLRRADAARRD